MLTPINPFANPGFDFGPRRRIQILPEDFGEDAAHGMSAGDFYQSTGLGDPSADEMLRAQAQGYPGGPADLRGTFAARTDRTRAKGPRGIAGILLGDDVEDDTVGSPETDAVRLDRSPLPGLDRPQLDADRVSGARRTAGLAGLAGLLDVALSGGDSPLAAAAGGVVRGANSIAAREQARYADEMGTYTDLIGEDLERADRMKREVKLREMEEQGRIDRLRIEEAGRMERELAGIEMEKVEEQGRMQREADDRAQEAATAALVAGNVEGYVSLMSGLTGLDEGVLRNTALAQLRELEAERARKGRALNVQEMNAFTSRMRAETDRLRALRPTATGGSRSGRSGGDKADNPNTLAYIEDMADLYGKNHPVVESLRRNYLHANNLNAEEVETTLEGARNAVANGDRNGAVNYINARVADGSISKEQGRQIARTIAGQ